MSVNWQIKAQLLTIILTCLFTLTIHIYTRIWIRSHSLRIRSVIKNVIEFESDSFLRFHSILVVLFIGLGIKILIWLRNSRFFQHWTPNMNECNYAYDNNWAQYIASLNSLFGRITLRLKCTYYATWNIMIQCGIKHFWIYFGTILFLMKK